MFGVYRKFLFTSGPRCYDLCERIAKFVARERGGARFGDMPDIGAVYDGIEHVDELCKKGGDRQPQHDFQRIGFGEVTLAVFSGMKMKAFDRVHDVHR